MGTITITNDCSVIYSKKATASCTVCDTRFGLIADDEDLSLLAFLHQCPDIERLLILTVLIVPQCGALDTIGSKREGIEAS